jgi:serine/threonine-protein kinase
LEPKIENVRSDDVPADRVTTQKPQPGEKAKEGSTVTIIVSSGPGDATIPFVRGSPRSQAEKKMKAAGFKVDVRQEYSDSVGKNHVIDTSPPEGSRLQRGSVVTLVVSRGPQKLAVPDVVGRNRDDAQRALQAAGLQVTFTDREDATKDPGTVLEMSPAAGTQVPKGSTVNLIVAKQPKQVAVPDVTTNAVNDAVNALEQAGFGVRQKEKKTTNPDEDGIVLAQNPSGGQKKDRGSRVTITVGRFDPGNLDPNATPTPSPTPSPTP